MVSSITTFTGCEHKGLIDRAADFGNSAITKAKEEATKKVKCSKCKAVMSNTEFELFHKINNPDCENATAKDVK